MPRYNLSSAIEGIKRLGFNTTPPAYPYREGRVYWDMADHTLSLMQADTTEEVVNQIGQEINVWVKNNTGGDVPNATAVYPVGSVGFRPSIALAQGDTVVNAQVRGITTQAIPNGGEGFVTTFGMVRDIDTQTPGWTEGDVLYLSPTVPGGLQNSPPTSGYTVRVGYVLRRHLSLGIVFVSIYGVPAFGNLAGGNYTAIEFDGTSVAAGNATCYKDELQSLVGQRLEAPGSAIVQNLSEGTLTFKTSSALTDYVIMNVQINHDWDLSSAIRPHIHWSQTTSATPNWLIEYRWQINGSAKTTAWSRLPWAANAYTWTAGDLNQITGFVPITKPVGAGLSDIVQFRLIRDNSNASGLFGGADPVLVSVDAVNFDVHYVVNMLGSRTEFAK